MFPLLSLRPGGLIEEVISTSLLLTLRPPPPTSQQLLPLILLGNDLLGLGGGGLGRGLCTGIVIGAGLSFLLLVREVTSFLSSPATSSSLSRGLMLGGGEVHEETLLVLFLPPLSVLPLAVVREWVSSWSEYLTDSLEVALIESMVLPAWLASMTSPPEDHPSGVSDEVEGAVLEFMEIVMKSGALESETPWMSIWWWVGGEIEMGEEGTKVSVGEGEEGREGEWRGGVTTM